MNRLLFALLIVSCNQSIAQPSPSQMELELKTACESITSVYDAAVLVKKSGRTKIEALAMVGKSQTDLQKTLLISAVDGAYEPSSTADVKTDVYRNCLVTLTKVAQTSSGKDISAALAIETKEEECFDVKYIRMEIVRMKYALGLIPGNQPLNKMGINNVAYKDKLESLELSIPAAKEKCKIDKVKWEAIEEADRVKREAIKVEKDRVAKLPGVRVGMTKEHVTSKTSWGEPSKINTTTTARGTFEQWVYGDSHYLYFTNGRLTTIQN
jgi:hypothetical protein